MMSQAEAEEFLRESDRCTTKTYYCYVCDEETVFYCHDGRKGGDSYSYCRCSKCGGVDTAE